MAQKILLDNTKLKHVQACLRPESQYVKSAGFEHVDLGHEAAAGLCIEKISTRINFLGFTLNYPIMIAPMTGGMELGALLNERWARAAEYFNLAFGVGSQRLALENPEVSTSFLVRRYAPHAFIFANLGAAQLIHTMTAEHALKAVEMIDAQALFIHINPLQEACQAHGDRSFDGLLTALTRVCERLHKHNIPVLAREVGFGLSEKSARALINCGIKGLDCAGAGGTSWTKVEALCASDEKHQNLGLLFGEWGIPTADSIRNVRRVDKNIPLLATGGIRSGQDIIKACKLGAQIAGMAQPMLKAAMKSEEELFSFIERIIHELKITLLAAGISDINNLYPG